MAIKHITRTESSALNELGQTETKAPMSTGDFGYSSLRQKINHLPISSLKRMLNYASSRP
jgi:hypothetical protein